MFGAFTFRRSLKRRANAQNLSFIIRSHTQVIFSLYLVCKRVSLSLTDLLDTLNMGIARLLRLRAICPHTSPLSLPFFGCLKGSWSRTSPQRITSWSSVHFTELFLKEKNVTVLKFLLHFWAGIKTNPALIAYHMLTAYTLTVKSKLVLIRLTLACIARTLTYIPWHTQI